MKRSLSLTLCLFIFALEPTATRAGTSFVRGDCNGDGNRGAQCEISDAVFLLQYLFVAGATIPPCEEACNTNGDENADVSDAVFHLNFCFGGGDPFPAPFPSCGEDPDAVLSCDTFTPCSKDFCPPQEASGLGDCATVLGVYWNGRRCREVAGCSCEGVDCTEGFDTIGECADVFSDCEPECPAQDARGIGPCDNVVGIFWDGRRCRESSGCECEGDECDRSFSSLTACEEEYDVCDATCVPQDATGAGDCESIVGIYWDGQGCRTATGCTCEGEDCEGIFATLDECLTIHETCRPDNCTPQDAVGVGACDEVVGIFWNGQICQESSGCSCVGADCDDGFASVDECFAAHTGCPNVCDRLDVSGAGGCAEILGWFYDGANGRGCQPLSGCTCEGEDCDEMFASREECEAVTADCGS